MTTSRPEAEELAALALAESRPKNKHGQLCPVWTRRMVSRGRHAKITECDCWILADARLDAAVVIAALAAAKPSPDPDLARLYADIEGMTDD